MKRNMEFINAFNSKKALVLMLFLLSSCEDNDLGQGSDFINDVLPDCYEVLVKNSDPVVYLRLNESSGESTAGDSGSAKNIPLNTGTTFGHPGVFGRKQNYAAYFDGSSSLNLGTDSYLQITGDQTIEVWVHPTTFGIRRNFFAKAYGGEGTITLETSGALNYYYGTGGGNTSPYQGFGSGSTIALDTWTHVALVRDLSSSRLHYYINGVETSNVAATFPAATISTLDMLVGDGYTANFIGYLDEFALYDRALSPATILSHYNLATGDCPD
jgi:hypothetical protein